MIRATTPLYSSSESCGRSVNKSSFLNSKKSKTIDGLSDKDGSAVNNSSKDKSDSDSIFSSLESILVKESVSNTTPVSQGTSSYRPEHIVQSKTDYHDSFDQEEYQLEENINKLLYDNVSSNRNVTAVETITNIMGENSNQTEKQKLKNLPSETLNGAGDHDSRERDLDTCNIVKVPLRNTNGQKSKL